MKPYLELGGEGFVDAQFFTPVDSVEWVYKLYGPSSPVQQNIARNRNEERHTRFRDIEILDSGHV